MKPLKLILSVILLLSLCVTSSAQSTITIIWEDLTPEISPAPRFHHAMIYDSDQDRAIMFGGNVGGSSGEITWEYDYEANTWSDREATNSPPGLNYHAMTYDSVNQKTIMFGGYSSNPSIIQDETYAYDYVTNNWTKMDPELAPSPRRSPNMVFDPANARAILFGGQAAQPGGGLDIEDDTWAYYYANNTWIELTPESAPAPRQVPAMTYDTLRDQVILFGGAGDYHSLFANDTWIFNINTDQWQEVNTTSFPTRGEIDIAYDQSIDKVLLYGGQDGEDVFDELWAFSPETLNWELITDYEGGPGFYITEQSMVFNTKHNLSIFYGGAGFDGGSGLRYGRTWSLQFVNEIISTSDETTDRTTSLIATTTDGSTTGPFTSSTQPSPLFVSYVVFPLIPFYLKSKSRNKNPRR